MTGVIILAMIASISCRLVLLLTEIFLAEAQTLLLHQTPTQFWVAEEAENKQMIHHQTIYIVIRSKNSFQAITKFLE